jgi:hypothetical protein
VRTLADGSLARPRASAAHDGRGQRGRRSACCLPKARLSGGVLHTNGCKATYAELSANGVTFLQEPTERPYGVEAVLRNDSGTWLALLRWLQASASGRLLAR